MSLCKIFGSDRTRVPARSGGLGGEGVTGRTGRRRKERASAWLREVEGSRSRGVPFPGLAVWQASPRASASERLRGVPVSAH
jgi:hypothetical protein